jgi:nitrite reductase/ring-hydroxylating ferredoxin subunit
LSLIGFEKVCRFSDLKEKDGKRFWVDDIDVAVIKVGDKVYAFSNVCPHQHSPVMYSGFVEEGCIVCPNHGWMFELEPGTVKNANKGLDKYEVKIENGDVFVKVTKKKDFNW